MLNFVIYFCIIIIMLDVKMLIVVMLNVIMPNVVMLNVVGPREEVALNSPWLICSEDPLRR
jgi:hypothetical protein